MLQCIHVNKNVSFYLQNADLLEWSGHKLILEKFIGHTDKDKCNIWGFEAAAIPRRVKVQHIKGIASVLADVVSGVKAVGIYHDIDSNDLQQEFSTPFEPLPLVEPVTHTPQVGPA